MKDSVSNNPTLPPPPPGRHGHSALFHGLRSPGVPGIAPPVATSPGPAKADVMHRTAPTGRRGFFSLFFVLLLASCFLLLSLTSPATAAPTQQDVFRSIQDNVSGEVDTSKFLYVLGGIIALVILIGVLGRQRKRAITRRSLNHPGKLLREVLKAAPLKTKELKQLKILADNADVDRPLTNPLTLMLCPSVMARTIQAKRLKFDRRALTSIARKAGLQVVRK
jgi:hypothetical protein